ncbi:peptide-binding protein [Stenotrophomonas sp. ATCM1_4]|jgi:hypothetical protein|uniref:Peptide-binding protein n=1 Tax=Stenotrophomonas capsici TaxID=3110230 RepID=A0ABU5V1F6_9GAMM|nr:MULTISPECIES: SH3 domain-containing protein [unclassified Stenotrophomonas]MBD9535711.1 peptide-binding protein [Stenotrophomonas sp. STM01]MEA5667188.1 peptide-binding protein [Stenotrophomonas sp. MH1]TDB27155.1 peptide-binding protein [Stenotrophomonas sp. ATCM1_4]
MQARLTGSHRSQYRNPLHVHTGQIVALGVRDEEWPAFAWVTTDAGDAGWTPIAWLRMLDDGRAEVLRDYSARELDVDRGEQVRLHHEHGGWWWSERADGTQGWLPARELELLEENCT